MLLEKRGRVFIASYDPLAYDSNTVKKNSCRNRSNLVTPCTLTNHRLCLRLNVLDLFIYTHSILIWICVCFCLYSRCSGSVVLKATPRMYFTNKTSNKSKAFQAHDLDVGGGVFLVRRQRSRGKYLMVMNIKVIIIIIIILSALRLFTVRNYFLRLFTSTTHYGAEKMFCVPVMRQMWAFPNG